MPWQPCTFVVGIKGWSQKRWGKFSTTRDSSSPSTLRSWECSLRSGSQPVDVTSYSHRPPALTSEQIDHLVWFCDSQKLQSRANQHRRGKNWQSTRLGVNVSYSTVQRYLHDKRLSSQEMRTKKDGFRKTDEELAKETCDWVKQQHTEKRLDGLGASLDFTFTSHRTDQQRTLGPKGRVPEKQRQNSWTYELYLNLWVERWTK